MTRYQSKPEYVDAYQVTPDTAQDIAGWVGGSVIVETDALDSSKEFVGVNVPTLDGGKRASEGDYVVLLVGTGRLKVLSAFTFEATYEEI